MTSLFSFLKGSQHLQLQNKQLRATRTSRIRSKIKNGASTPGANALRKGAGKFQEVRMCCGKKFVHRTKCECSKKISKPSSPGGSALEKFVGELHQVQGLFWGF